MSFHDYLDAEFGVIEAYDHGQYSHADAYRHAFKIAMRIYCGLWGE